MKNSTFKRILSVLMSLMIFISSTPLKLFPIDYITDPSTTVQLSEIQTYIDNVIKYINRQLHTKETVRIGI